ncbi:hypothetical protein [Cryptosporangium aurantiacum]|uniref:Uncharacterized protein n=1 Tax=Cryptosporangium aurantiacum TaxID=134849 RepID=A0A1M7RLS2_9ACTN|nr:hypothetical protein [Cryptosporangium aurantiacum]SHN47204.1 hypothetical protein SAMN05443668_12152 [Cryptosporangium aurantiacum]
MGKKRLRLALAAVGAAILGAVFTAAPASAADAGAGQQDYNPAGCDALLYVSDTTSPGRVEGFGGFSCAQSKKMIGNMTVTLYKGGTKVCSKGVAFNKVSTSETGCSVADPSGNQSWKSHIRIVDIYGQIYFSTGTITT